MTVEWRDVKGYEGVYQVSNTGEVKRVAYMDAKHNKWVANRVLKKFHNQKGYLFVALCKDGQDATKRVHRLVAEAFIPNPDNLEQVNHIDCNKQNNTVENLEWCSLQDNIRHGVLNGRYKGRGGKL